MKPEPGEVRLLDRRCSASLDVSMNCHQAAGGCWRRGGGYSPFEYWDSVAFKIDNVPVEPLDCVDGDSMDDGQVQVDAKEKKMGALGLCRVETRSGQSPAGPFQAFGGQEGQQGTSLSCRQVHIMAVSAPAFWLPLDGRSGQIPPAYGPRRYPITAHTRLRHHQYVSPIVSFLSLSTVESQTPKSSKVDPWCWLCLPHPHHCPSNPTSSSQELSSKDEALDARMLAHQRRRTENLGSYE